MVSEWPLVVDFCFLGFAIAHICFVGLQFTEFKCSSSLPMVFLLSYCFAIQGRTYQLILRAASDPWLKLVVLVLLGLTSISLAIFLAFLVAFSVFPLSYSETDCVMTMQLPKAFEAWRLYVWLADSLVFIAAGYFASVGAYLEVVVDYYTTPPDYIPLQGPASLGRGSLITQKAKERIAEHNEGTCGICLCEIEANDIVLPMPRCTHAFHSPCIAKWLSAKPVCPICKVDARQ